MGLTELITLLGDDNIQLQNFANSCNGGTTNKRGEVTYKFVTEKPLFDVLMAKSVTGLVLWIDTAKLNAAMAKASS